MNSKIQPTHVNRDAYVYVRQSSMTQVRTHLEGQRRQYDLAESARSIGFVRVVVIDEDLGRSGSGSIERPGFARLLAAVCASKVGAVFALEASRLARNNRDWHHLIDLCALTHTLVVDHDGVYDPCQLNDRLVLGLKGTMSEFEISLLRQRAMEARRQKVARGMVLTQVPIGYRRTDDDGIELTPDIQIQQSVRLIFAKFRELGSARQVYLWFKQEKLPLPVWGQGRGKWEESWRAAKYASIYRVLSNPTYAGAFVHGRHKTITKFANGRAFKSQGHRQPQERWEVFIPDHHDAYISWDDYQQNQRTLASNAAMRGRMHQPGNGATKNGPALLSGLLRCGKCGRMLSATYGGRTGRDPFYRCPGENDDHLSQNCTRFGGRRVDQAVVTEAFEAIEPQMVEASIDGWRRFQEGEGEKRQQLSLALEKARYEADRAERQYNAIEPENRLVAGELERRWNDALMRVADLEKSLEELRREQSAVNQDEHDRLVVLANDLQRVWDHPDCPVPLKKRLLRTIIEEIVVWEDKEPLQLRLKVHWVGGVHTDLTVKRNRWGNNGRGTTEQLIEIIRQLAMVCGDDGIVSMLNRLGYRTGTGMTWSEKRVQHVRHAHGIPACPTPDQRTWVTREQAAHHLGVSHVVVQRLIDQKILPARQVVKFAPWIIEKADLEGSAVRRAVRFAKERRRLPLSKSGAQESPLFQPSNVE